MPKITAVATTPKDDAVVQAQTNSTDKTHLGQKKHNENSLSTVPVFLGNTYFLSLLESEAGGSGCTSEQRTRPTFLSNHLANERTYLAYLRTAISLMRFRIAINRFSIFLA